MLSSCFWMGLNTAFCDNRQPNPENYFIWTAMLVGPTLAQRRYCRLDVEPTLAQFKLLSRSIFTSHVRRRPRHSEFCWQWDVCSDPWSQTCSEGRILNATTACWTDHRTDHWTDPRTDHWTDQPTYHLNDPRTDHRHRVRHVLLQLLV